jgi:hypothetical protein
LGGRGKFYVQKKNGETQGYLYVPAGVVKDSQFPFKHREEVDIKMIPGEKTIVVSALDAPKGGIAHAQTNS